MSAAPALRDAQCPIGHKGEGVHELAEEIAGDVEDALHCSACPANYIKVRGGWFEAPALPISVAKEGT